MLKKLFGPGKPKWEVVSSSSTPGWVRKKITQIYKYGAEGDPGDVLVYRFEGKRFRYKVEIPWYAGEGYWRASGEATVYRKPRTWYWKELTSQY